MAREISEIYDRLNTVKAGLQELHDYTVDPDNPYSYQDNFETLQLDVKSSSKVANWRLWIFVFSVGSWVVEKMFDRHKDEVTKLLAEKTPHTLRWYAEETKKFQFGYALIWKDNKFLYEKIDETARIVKYAAASEKNGKIIIKVTAVVNGVKQPLSTVQLAALREFWTRWKDAGDKIEIISLPPDILKVGYTIIRDRLVLNSNNSLVRDSSVFPIKEAIDTYASNLEFDGKIILSKLTDAVQIAEGVVDVKLVSAQWKPAGGVYASVDMSVESKAGYFIIPQESAMTYIDNVKITIES